jgi:hypothetical protein
VYIYIYTCPTVKNEYNIIIYMIKHTVYINWLFTIQSTNWNVQNMHIHLLPNLFFFWDSAWVEVATVSESRIFGMKKIFWNPSRSHRGGNNVFFLPLWHLIGPALSARGDPPWLGYQGGRSCPFFAVLESHLPRQELWFHPVVHF